MKFSRLVAAFLIIFCINIISLQNAFARVSVIGPMTHEYTVEIGEELKGEIVLKNPGTEDVTIRLYQRDYSFDSDGKSFYLEPNSLEHSNASWIHIDKTRVSLAPNNITTIKFTIKVPNDNNLIGTYWSMIMVEPLSAISLVEEGGKDVNVTIHETVRYGIQIVTSIGNSGEKKLEFVKASLNANDDGTMQLTVDMKNTGQRWLKPDVWVDLFDESGSQIGRFKATNKRLFPGTSVRHLISLGNLRQGKYMALVVADDGEEFVVGAEYTLNVGKR